MDINASIIDQQVRGLAESMADRLEGDEVRRRSTAFVLLCIRAVLDLSTEEALDCLTEGAHDADVDGLHIGPIQDREFVVTLFQGKYKQDLDGRSAFPANAIKKLIGTVGSLFDPNRPLSARAELEAKIEDIRSLLKDGIIPVVRVVLCNNGQRWGQDGQEAIDNAGFPPEQVSWEHVNHDRLVQLLQRRKPVNETLQLTGSAIAEDFNFRRVLIGKLPVMSVKALFDRHGDKLLERNIRRYLGLRDNRVNTAIRATLLHPQRRQNFYFYNNGITAVCSKFRYNALQEKDFLVQVEDLQIINGGQTCKTIQNTLSEAPAEDYSKTYVLLRLYELGGTDDDLVGDITYATNSQNPVDLRDLRANDEIQRALEAALPQLGYEYKRKRDDGGRQGPTIITSSVAAEAVFSVWRRKPHQAKFRRGELFNDPFYGQIFTKDLNAAQLILAVLIFRFAENERRRPSSSEPPRFMPYASYFLAMLMGEELLAQHQLRVHQVDHRNFNQLRDGFEARKAELYQHALGRLHQALGRLGLREDVSLQRLASTFRRSDLLDELEGAGPRA